MRRRCSCRRAVALALVAAILALPACAVDPLRARRAAATAAAAQDRTLTCTTADACAPPSPYQALALRAFAESTGAAPVHFVNLLDRGADALALRLHLIRSARRSIDLQTFIFAEDDAGFLVLDELIRAARRGVQVRVIVDQLFSLDDAQLYATLAHAHANFELRVYNPTFHKSSTQPVEFAAGVLCCFWRFNQRMHNKLLLVDDAIGIAGGRNYENRYYDWDAGFDYRDRDVLVAGPAAAQMRASFDRFWSDRRTAPLSRLRDVAAWILDLGLAAPGWQAHEYAEPARVAALSREADDPGWIRAHFADAAARVGRVEYFSDAPGKRQEQVDTGDSSDLSRRVMALVSQARASIVLQTPYLVLSPAARDVFARLHREHPQLRVLVSTNSLAATDAFYVYALSYKYKKRYLKLGFEIHEFKPFPAEAGDVVAGYAALAGGAADGGRYERYGRAPLTRAGVRLGLHAKSMVIDDEVTVIGSHNFDPRSDHYNTESGFIVYDRDFAATVAAAIRRDCAPENAWTIARRPRSVVGRVNNAIATVSAALPIFDFWPFRYATSYELKEGCAESRPSEPGFYDCHVAVGDFPEVSLPLKTIYTRIVTAFGAGLLSIM